MNFSCGSCGQPYSIADEKVQGRAFRVTCRQCGKEIRVPASRPATAAPPPAPAPARTTGKVPVAPPRPSAPPPLPVRPRLTPVSTRVAGELPPPPSAGPGMTDDELRWLSGSSAARGQPTRPAAPGQASALPPPRRSGETTTDATAPGTTTDDVFGALAAEAAATTGVNPARSGTTASGAALRAVPPTDDSVVDSWLSAEPVPPAPRDLIDEGPDELPPLPGHEGDAGAGEAADVPVEDAEAGEASPDRGPGRLRIAAAAVLLVAAGAVGAWRLGWLGGSTPAPRPVPPPMVATPPVIPPPAEPAPAPAEPPATEATAESPPAPPTEAAAPDSPAPAPGSPKRPAAGDRMRPSLRITRKDRRLLDLLEKKGDEATVSGVERSTLDTGQAELDQAAVERTLEDYRPAFSACVTRAIKGDGGARLDDRTATLMLTVRPNGTVAKAWIAEADLEAQPVGKCLASAARRMIFPAFQGEVLDVSAPLKLAAVR